ncbi:Transcriptional regulatory protein YpdB [bacterium HR32]|nr:Transcriptional regulatory protein YpdB [bacterium HR32]
MRVLIVDDEYPARKELRAQLSQFPDVEIVGEAATADEARKLIAALSYDVVFLDIEMPGRSGLELARELAQAGGPRVVFTTAYPQYAVEAFDVGAAGYLLKPFDEDRLAKVLERLGARAGPTAEAAASAPPPRIPAHRNDVTVLVAPEEVVFAYAEAEQVYLKLHRERLGCRFTLRELETRLRPHGFLRVHRRFVVNLAKVREVVPYFKGNITLVVDDAQRTEVPVSRALAPVVRRSLGLRED